VLGFACHESPNSGLSKCSQLQSPVCKLILWGVHCLLCVYWLPVFVPLVIGRRT